MELVTNGKDVNERGLSPFTYSVVGLRKNNQDLQE